MPSSVTWSERFEYFSSFLKYIFHHKLVSFCGFSLQIFTLYYSCEKKCDFQFLIDSQIIDVVQECTRLRNSNVPICPHPQFVSITWTSQGESSSEALFSLIRHTNLSKLKAALACKIFDTMISPILTYKSEIWGVYAKPDFKTWDGSQIEKAHLQFCKRYLEVNNKASNIACRAELGRFP